jgi:hypothetical protein
MTVATLLHDRVHGLRGLESLQRFGNRRMQSPDRGEPSSEERLQCRQLAARLGRFEKLFKSDARRSAPKFVERGVMLGELLRRDAEQKLGGTGS